MNYSKYTKLALIKKIESLESELNGSMLNLGERNKQYLAATKEIERLKRIETIGDRDEKALLKVIDRLVDRLQGSNYCDD